MAEQARLEQVEARPVAGVRTTAPRGAIGDAIYRALDEVWPVLRAQQAKTGHNVVIYDGGDDATVTMFVGVEVFSDVTEHGDVRGAATPTGEVVTIAHVGDYAAMAPSYQAMARWCEANDRSPSGISWEVYGDWDEDPAKVRTDLFLLLA